MLFGPPVIEWLASRLLRRPLVLDLDDATWIAYASPVYGRIATLLKWPSKTDRLIRLGARRDLRQPEHRRVRPRARRGGGRRADRRRHAALPSGRDASHARVSRRSAGSARTAPIPFFERLLPIFERLAREVPFRLTIVGSGRDRSRRARRRGRDAAVAPRARGRGLPVARRRRLPDRRRRLERGEGGIQGRAVHGHAASRSS